MTKAPAPRLRSVSITLPPADAPVVECPRAASFVETTAVDCAGQGKRKSPDNFWSTSAMVGFDMSDSSAKECRSSTKSTEEGDHDGEDPLLVLEDALRGLPDCAADAASQKPADPAVRGIVLFLPSLGGGAQDYRSSLFQTASIDISSCAGIECCHVEWPQWIPATDTDSAVDWVLYHLQQEIGRIRRSVDLDLCPQHFRVFLVGYGVGGAVATQAVSELAWLYGKNNCPNFSVTIDGLCAINPASHWHRKGLDMAHLQNIRTLLVADQQDSLANLDDTRDLFAALPATRKEMFMLTEDRGKEVEHENLLLKLTSFVSRALLMD